MAQLLEFINKDIQTTITNILHIFKKVVENMIRTAIKDFLKTHRIPEMKTAMSGMENMLYGINIRIDHREKKTSELEEI